MKRERATFIGIGAQKCASTWLYGVLPQLQGVQVGLDKEIDFFSYYFDRGYEWYERQFPGGSGILHRGEISPSYFIDSDATARARAYNPDLMVLVTLRDPVARAYSNHLHEVRKGHISGANLRFETALANNPLYVEQGLYAKHLSRWLEHFPAGQVLVLFQEGIHRDPHGAAGEVARFLGVPEPESLTVRRANESVSYSNQLIGQSLWRLGKLARGYGMGAAVEGLKTLPGVRSLRAANRREVSSTIPPMEDATERRLTERFGSEIEALAKLVGRRPPWPRFDGIAAVA